MNRLRLEGKPFAETLLDERAALEEVVAQDSAEFSRQIVRQTAVRAEIQSSSSRPPKGREP